MKILMELEKAVHETQENLKIVVDEEARALEHQKFNALMEIVTYVNSLSWLKQKNAKEKLRFLLKTKFDKDNAAVEFNTTKNAIEVSLSRSQKILSKRIGNDTIRLILAGKVDQAMAKLRESTNQGGQNNELILNGVFEFLPKSEKGAFLIEECGRELYLLGRLSRFNIKKNIGLVNQKKLAHVLYIMSRSDERTADIKETLTSFLEGDFADVEGSQISVKDQVGMVFETLEEQNLFS
ncbi:hypothetical protein [Salipaludibacillus sp. CF4.18]|uniref:hypothetical protein n=1 Tax=Salipaludibacillus sp. CF4.18 TaxID=3373081 RepID=UPI003EE7E88F